MAKKIEMIFDFGSPNAYLAYYAIPRIWDGLAYDLRMTSCLLGGIFKESGNQSPMLAFSHIPAKLAYIQVEMQRFAEKHALHKFRMNPHFPVNTLLLARGAIAAQEMAVLSLYIDAGLRAMWEEGLKMDEPEIFTMAMNKAGLDGGALLSATRDDRVKKSLIENTQSAVERGVFGVPSFFVGDALYFGKDQLLEITQLLKPAIT